MKVFATNPALIDFCPMFGSALIFMSSTLMMREKRLIRSKKSARLWYVPSSAMSIGHSA